MATAVNKPRVNALFEFVEIANSTFPEDAAKRNAYARMRLRGESHNLAELLASRRAPGIGITDSIFMSGRWGKAGIQDEEVANLYRQIAQDNGVSSEGKTYCSQLASFPGDPSAWIDSVADVKRVAADKGMTLEGGINYTPSGVLDNPVDDLDGPYEVAEDIIDDEIVSAAEDNPDLAEEWVAKPEKLADAREQVKEIFSGDL